MKILILLSLFCSIAIASVEDCETQDNAEAKSLAKSLSLPNCFNESSIIEVKNQDTENVCNTCKSKFETIYGKKIVKPAKNKLQADFLDSAAEEYKKNIINNILFTLKMRALPSTGDTFSKASTACKMVNEESFLKNCKSESAKSILRDKKIFASIQDSVRKELAKIVSTSDTYNPQGTLLTRPQPACFIPEKDILFLSSATIEEAFSPDLINYLSSIDVSKFKSIDDLFNSPELKAHYTGEIDELTNSLKKHPYLSQIANNPSEFSSFFKSIEKPADVTKLRKSLYSESQGKKLDSDLAARCSESLNAFAESICSDKFENGNITTDPFQNFDKLPVAKIQPEELELASSEELIQKNTDFLSLCELKNEPNSLNLSTVNENISKKLENSQRGLNLTDFKILKFDSELGQLNEFLCNGNNSSCDIKKLNCQILQKYKKLQDKSSTEYKLANSSNKEVNALLRTMIGDSQDLDAKTREILVSQGILPKADGTMVAQAEIPERQPGYFSQSQQVQQAQTPNQNTAQAASAKTAPRRTNSSSNADYGTSTVSNLGASPLPDFSDLYRDQSELQAIEDEIKRRLTSLPENKPATKAAAKKIARDAFRSSGRQISPSQEEAFANRMMSHNSDPSSNDDVFDQQTGSGREASVSNSDSAAEKWKKDGMNRALADMHGAKGGANAAATGGRGPASAEDDASAKPLTTVALNIAEDPRLSLSQSLADKINKNDSETQILQVLVKNKKNFILQVKSVNFKVVFDDKKQLRILLESGDAKEAERLRPQLELFFKRLNSL